MIYLNIDAELGTVIFSGLCAVVGQLPMETQKKIVEFQHELIHAVNEEQAAAKAPAKKNTAAAQEAGRRTIGTATKAAAKKTAETAAKATAKPFTSTAGRGLANRRDTSQRDAYFAQAKAAKQTAQNSKLKNDISLTAKQLKKTGSVGSTALGGRTSDSVLMNPANREESRENRLRRRWGEEHGTRGSMGNYAPPLKPTRTERNVNYTDALRQVMTLDRNERAGVNMGSVADRLKKKKDITMEDGRDLDFLRQADSLIRNFDRIPAEEKTDAAIMAIQGRGNDFLSTPQAQAAFDSADEQGKALLLKAARETVGYTPLVDRWNRDVNRSLQNAGDDRQRQSILTAASGVDFTTQKGRKAAAEESARRAFQDAYTAQQKGVEFTKKYLAHGYSTHEYLADRREMGARAWYLGLADAGLLPAESFLDMDREGYLMGDFKSPFSGISAKKNPLQNAMSYLTNMTTDVLTLAALPQKWLYRSAAELSPELRSGSRELYRFLDQLSGRQGNLNYQRAMEMKAAVGGENKNGLVRGAGDIEESITQMLPSLLLSIAQPEIGMAMFGTSAGGMYARDALDNGSNLQEAISYGVVCGTLEASVEKIFPNMGTFGKSFSEMLLGGRVIGGKVLFDSTVRQLAEGGFRTSMRGRILRGLGESLGEFTEEALMEVIEPFVRRATFDPKAEAASLEQIGMAGLTGAAIAAVLHAPAGVIQTTGTLAERVYVSDQKKYMRAKLEDSIAVIENMATLGMISEQEAEKRIAAVTHSAGAAMAELSGTGSLSSVNNEQEIKTTGLNLNPVYGSRAEAIEATRHGSTAAAFSENGEMKQVSRKSGMLREDVLTSGEKARYAEKSAKIAQAKNETERTGYQLNVREDVIRETSALSEHFGRDVIFYDGREAWEDHGERGYIKGGKIYVNIANDTPTQTVIAHEMTHAMKGTKAFDVMLEEVKRYYKDSFEHQKDVLRGYGYSEAELEEEVLAHFAEQKLLTDAAWIHSFMTENGRAGERFANVIVRGINSVIQKGLGGKETRFLADVRTKWLKALEEERKGGNEKTAAVRTEAVYAAKKEEESIRGQIRKHQDELNKMEPVAHVSEASWKGTASGNLRKEIVNYMRQTGGFIVDVSGFGQIVIDEKRISNSLRYLSSKADAIAYKAIKPVLKHGKIILEKSNHKGRDYGTVTFAAPVIINGVRGNMAVVVKRTGKNYYKMHRVISPTGKVLDMENAEPTYGGGVTENGSLATPISSASDKSIAQMGEDGKGKRYAKGRSRDAAYMAAVEEGDMETAQRLVDEAARAAGYTVKAYHGTARGDRVGTVFLPERATSGPMAFFTDDRQIAENYANDKADTSIAYDPDFDRYETQFRIKTRAGADIPLHEAWKYLSLAAKKRIRTRAEQLREDWDGDNELILDPETKEANGGFQWQIVEARGNIISALEEQWLNSGNLYNEERRFLDVLKMSGVTEEFRKIGMDTLYFKDPDERHEKVYDTYLRIEKPFDATKEVTEAFVKQFEAWYAEQDSSFYDRESVSADFWDKNSVSAEKFAERMRNDIQQETTHAWTSIPDSMTDYLKHLHYDGIKDTGGKYTGEQHTVWIPFYSEQVKSADPVTYDDAGNVVLLSERFDDEKEDIRWAKGRITEADVSWETLINKPDMKVTVVPSVDEVPLREDGSLDRKEIIRSARESIRKLKNPLNTERQQFIRIKDTKQDVLISRDGIDHGLSRSKVTAAVTMNFGPILENSVIVNELDPRGTELFSYIALGVAKNDDEIYIVRSIINVMEGNVAEIKEIEVFDRVFSIQAQQRKTPARDFTPIEGTQSSHRSLSVISIRELLDLVKDTYPEILSMDVLRHYGIMERPKSNLVGVRYAKGAPRRSREAAELAKYHEQKLKEVLYSRDRADGKELWDMLRAELNHSYRTGAYRQREVEKIVNFAYRTGYREEENRGEDFSLGGSIYIPGEFRGEMETLGGLAAVNRSLFGTGTSFTYQQNGNGIDEAYEEAREMRPDLFPETDDPSEQVQNIVDALTRETGRMSLEDLDDEAGGAFAETETPYYDDIKDAVIDAMDEIAAVGRRDMRQRAKQEGKNVSAASQYRRGRESGMKQGERKGRREAETEQDRLDRATMREFDKLERQRAEDRRKEISRERRDDEATMRIFDDVVKQVRREERDLSREEKRELKRNFEQREREIKAEQNRRAALLTKNRGIRDEPVDTAVFVSLVLGTVLLFRFSFGAVFGAVGTAAAAAAGPVFPYGTDGEKEKQKNNY
ncbi:MAG: hypothetical protein ACOX8R_00560 [Bacillota bacterium]